MNKQKILEMAFEQIEATIGDELFDYAENHTMVLATLSGIWGIVRHTERLLKELEMKEK